MEVGYFLLDSLAGRFSSVVLSGGLVSGCVNRFSSVVLSGGLVSGCVIV